MKLEVKILTIVLIIILIALIFQSYGSILGKWLSNDDSGSILKNPSSGEGTKIIFLHHSTGRYIWEGGVRDWIKNYNMQNSTNYCIKEQDFPKAEPYGWNNYPYDYWNIWVNHAGEEPYMDEPTLEMICDKYDVVIWKHCFPVSDIQQDTGNADIKSDVKSLENYKLQYEALKEKIREFNQTKFILWTIPALVEKQTTEEKAKRAQEFYNWVKNQWDEIGDNIYLWDFYHLETEDGLYLKEEYAKSPTNSHPSKDFSSRAAPFLAQRIVDVIEDRGDSSNITGN